jgi:hypothetical protein
LETEIQAAHKLLSLPENAGLWPRFCTPELVRLVRSRNIEAVARMRIAFYHSPELIELSQDSDTKCTRTLAWTIIVESALLNDRLLSGPERMPVPAPILASVLRSPSATRSAGGL